MTNMRERGTQCQYIVAAIAVVGSRTTTGSPSPGRSRSFWAAQAPHHDVGLVMVREPPIGKPIRAAFSISRTLKTIIPIGELR
jgi:hypothetical protein